MVTLISTIFVSVHYEAPSLIKLHPESVTAHRLLRPPRLSQKFVCSVVFWRQRVKPALAFFVFCFFALAYWQPAKGRTHGSGSHAGHRGHEVLVGDALWEGSAWEDRTSVARPIREKAGFPWSQMAADI